MAADNRVSGVGTGAAPPLEIARFTSAASNSQIVASVTPWGNRPRCVTDANQRPSGEKTARSTNSDISMESRTSYGLFGTCAVAVSAKTSTANDAAENARPAVISFPLHVRRNLLRAFQRAEHVLSRQL